MPMLADFHWLRPEWLAALPPVLLAAILLARRRLAAGNWQRVVDPALAPHVLSAQAAGRGDRRWWLLALGGVLAVLALAGPAWERVEQPVFRSEHALVIALDLSYSMDAEDVSPSRLARARLKVLDILRRRQGGQTALVVYSANAFTVTPLTTDADTVAALVTSLGTDIMPSRGSYPAAAIDKGRELLQQAGARDGEVLLVTDGGATSAARDAARELREAGYRLSVLGIGTLEGAPIPQPGGGFVTDPAGRIAVPRLEAETLRSLAAAGGGRYAAMTADDGDVERLLSDVRAVAADAANDALTTDRWRDEGPWLLLLLVPLAALSFRRGWLLILVLGVLPPGEPAQAFGWQDLWKNDDQQAIEKLREGEAAAAAEQFDDPDWQAVARYRAGDYGASARYYADRPDVDGRYNLGNSLARLGRFEAAIEAYDEALRLDPGADDARYNREIVREAMERQQARDGEQGDGRSSSEAGGGAQSAESNSDAEGSGEASSGGDPGSESENGSDGARDEAMSEEDLEAMRRELERAAAEAGQSEENAGDARPGEAQLAAERRAQEQQQAMEQWLRRIPDDPGGLLRRKFRYLYQRQGYDQDGNHLWPDDEMEPW